eukprot:gnl/MRDRNA2_/MRDRNA2_38570_c0_seq1.p1 gnl/MRDRNA2_/MRDRNA2_38570_c0~~gnl/MRDRNA2_/MRDRNA2_38570_c0_seq1.p1  ORF type:complete len:269 (+),score=47.98 gnl/MRDRNA2_/MRDRNA2_38570_c0_seq1:24-809(+)
MRHPWHYDSESFVTVVIPLTPKSNYAGGLYLQRGFDRAGREYLNLEAGEAAIHDYNLRHGVEVLNGERVSLIIWFKTSPSSCAKASLAPWIQEDAVRGDPNAQLNMGSVLAHDGESSKALEWYQKAADKGHTIAMFNLAMVHTAEEDPSLHDPAKAVMWSHRAASRGHPQAMSNLGVFYMSGFGDLERNATEGLIWLQKAAEQGVDQAMYLLAGASMETAQGKSKGNLTPAAEWYRKAAMIGHPQAITELANLEAQGIKNG